MRELKERVIKQDLIDWKSLKWIQGDLKKITPETFEKLLKSIEENDIIKAFHVWEHEGELFCLDGNHLKKALEEIEKRGKIKIPGKLKADFIDCKDLKDAKKMVLVYSAQYADISSQGLYDYLFKNELIAEYKDIETQIKIPEIDFDIFKETYFKETKTDVFADEPPTVNQAAELQKKWQVESGQIWQLGKHRLICGDCTDQAIVEKLMQCEKATLLHADPPYGMGKENEGILNDNLYNEKLDKFQMSWWKSNRPALINNASVYIWGTAEDIWRLWYNGGLKTGERLTFRNEIVWNKKFGQGILSDRHRMYPTVSERCLFFMLGEQGFSINADNYWDGWDPIVNYLNSQKTKMSWSDKDVKRIVGHSEISGVHWFKKSQWGFPTREVYIKLQSAANNSAFKREYDDLKREYDDLKREYDDLKREYYATRAFFNNTHDKMTDVWEYESVLGEERFGHATPKPVGMIERIIKSSSAENDLILVPFAGTAPEVVACENLNRQCRMIEISPDYCSVILERWSKLTNQEPKLMEL